MIGLQQTDKLFQKYVYKLRQWEDKLTSGVQHFNNLTFYLSPLVKTKNKDILWKKNKYKSYELMKFYDTLCVYIHITHKIDIHTISNKTDDYTSH